MRMMRGFSRAIGAGAVAATRTRRRRWITLGVIAAAMLVGMLSGHHTDAQTAKVEHQWYLQNVREAKRYEHMKPLPTGPVCTTTTKVSTTTRGGGTSQTTHKGHATSTTNRTPTTSTQTTRERQCKR